ncbi:unnamed protein product, partial [marine sediment metagenome]
IQLLAITLTEAEHLFYSIITTNRWYEGGKS